MNMKSIKNVSRVDSQIISVNIKRKRPELRDLKNVEETKSRQKLKCHFCRQRKDIIALVICLNYKECHHAFCYECISKHFKNKETRKIPKIAKNNWVCFTCRGLCRCDRCKLDLIKELSFLSDGISSCTESESVLTDKGSKCYNSSNNIGHKVK